MKVQSIGCEREPPNHEKQSEAVSNTENEKGDTERTSENECEKSREPEKNHSLKKADGKAKTHIEEIARQNARGNRDGCLLAFVHRKRSVSPNETQDHLPRPKASVAARKRF